MKLNESLDNSPVLFEKRVSKPPVIFDYTLPTTSKTPKRKQNIPNKQQKPTKLRKSISPAADSPPPKMPSITPKECSVVLTRVDEMLPPKSRDKTSKQANLSGFFTRSTNPEERYMIPKDEPVILKSGPAETGPVKKKISEDHEKLIEEIDKRSAPVLNDPELEGFMFGDIVEAIQLYNSLVSLYVDNSFVPKQKKKGGRRATWGKRSTREETVDEKVKLNETVLEYDSFLRMIKTDANEHEKEAFCDLIRNLFKILLQHEDVYDKIKIFGLALKDITLHNCMLQELCRIVENCSLHQNTLTEVEILTPTPEKIEQSKVLGLLKQNKSEEAFKSFSPVAKLSVLKALCTQILTGDKYNEHLESARGKLENLQAVLRNLRSELWQKLNITDTKEKQRGLKHNLKSANKTGWLEQLEKKEKQLESLQANLMSIERFIPLGSDVKEQVYWYFPCFKQLVVERKTEDIERSEWLGVAPEEIEAVIEVLKKHKQDKGLVERLGEVFEKYLSKEVAKEEESEKMNESDNETLADDENNDWKKKFSGYERRQTRSITKRVDSPTTTDTESEETTTLVPDDHQQTSETREEWLSIINTAFGAKPTYTLDNLLLFIINKENYIYFSGNFSHPDKYAHFKQLVATYQTQVDFDAKFEAIKNILIAMPKIQSHKCRLIYLEVGKKGLWEEMIAASESLSNLYLLVLAQFYMVNWKILKIIPCDICKKRGARFERVESLAELDEYWKDQVENKRGFVMCFKCDWTSKTRAAHRECLKELPVEEDGHYRCESCFQKKGFYEFVNEAEQKEIDDAKLAAELENCENRTRKSKKVHNYCEENHYKPRKSRSSASSYASESTNHSENEIEKESNTKKASNKKPRRSETKPATRSSGRIQAANIETTKRPNYNDETSEDATDTE